MTRWRVCACCTFAIIFILLTYPYAQGSLANCQIPLKADRASPTSGEPRIPRQIWQIYFPPPGGDKHDQLRHISKWATMAPDYTYTLQGSHGGDEFVRSHFSNKIFETYRLLRNPALKSDFLRYLLLYAKGGYYSDLDTRPVRLLDDWIPAEHISMVGLIISFEHDDGINAAGYWPYPVQFCQWTIVAAPGHVALKRMIERSIRGLQDLAQAQNVRLDQINPTDRQIMNATGPPAWTEVIFEIIQKVAPEITSFADLSRLAEPRLYEDILLLPMDAFMTLSSEMKVLEGAGQNQLVHHDFSGAWKSPVEE
jgi:alpha 1,6-mannosyltransferase